MEPQAPIVIALIICDGIIVEAQTGKRTLIGLFSAIYCRKFPAVHPSLTIYMSLTDGLGESTIELSIIDSATETVVLWKTEITLQFEDPRALLEAHLMTGPFTIPEPGKYRLRLSWQKRILLDRPLHFVSIPEADHG